MSRLLYLPIVGVIALVLGSWEQPSQDAGNVSLPRRLLSSAASATQDRSLQLRWSALTPRMTQGIFGGERVAQNAHELPA